MPHTFHTLPIRSLAVDTVVFRSLQGVSGAVEMEGPALSVMTDLKKVKVFTVTPEITIDDTLQKMIHAEVRLLIVTGASDALLGVISATDIMGERPISVSSAERIPHNEIRVEQIMTPREHLEALRIKDVEDARVGDIVATLRDAGRQHAIVVDDNPDTEILRDMRHEHAVVLKRRAGNEFLRGIFSLTQIARQLGVSIEPGGRAQTFAELERALAAR